MIIWNFLTILFYSNYGKETRNPQKKAEIFSIAEPEKADIMKTKKNVMTKRRVCMKYYLDAEVSTGWILRIVEEREAIVQIHILRKPETAEADMELRETALLLEAKRQLEEYFAGIRAGFSLPLAPEGTEFQKSVWQQLEAIPFGETRTYGQIAAAAGNPKACRAVGGAIHKNPIAIMIPCHRVIGADGSLTGFASGLDVKEALLHLEGIIKE